MAPFFEQNNDDIELLKHDGEMQRRRVEEIADVGSGTSAQKKFGDSCIPARTVQWCHAAMISSVRISAVLEKCLDQELILATHSLENGRVTHLVLYLRVGTIVQQQFDETGKAFGCSNDERGLKVSVALYIQAGTSFDQITSSLKLVVICGPSQRRAIVILDVVGVEHETKGLI